MQEKCVLSIDTPKNCLECRLHIMGLERDGEIFSCAGYKGRGTLNPECDFLNTYDSYRNGVARNCPLQNDPKITLNDYRDKCYEAAKKKGFHEKEHNFGELLMLIVSELSEALEADRIGFWSCYRELRTPIKTINDLDNFTDWYDYRIKGSVEEEIADAIIRLFDLAGVYDIDLDYHVALKLKYNEFRLYRHGKKY